MEDFFNSLFKAFSGENNSSEEQTTEVPSSRMSSASVDSGYTSRTISFSEDSSRRNSSAIVAAPPSPDNSPNNSPPRFNNPPPRNNPNDGGWGGPEIIAGIAGVAIAGYAIKKLFFDSSEPKASSSSGGMRRGGYEEEEEEVAWRKVVKLKNKASNIFDPNYIDRVSQEIRRDTEEYPVIGLDCQWTQIYMGNLRKPVALLQVSSHKGKTVLIRLSKGQKVPHDIGTLLNDPKIIKSGIETFQDAQKLLEDHWITVSGTYDLRFLAEATGRTPDSLDKMAKKILGREINTEMRRSDWDAPELSEAQIEYAKSTPQISIDVFKVMIRETIASVNKNSILNYCANHLNEKYIYRSERWN